MWTCNKCAILFWNWKNIRSMCVITFGERDRKLLDECVMNLFDTLLYYANLMTWQWVWCFHFLSNFPCLFPISILIITIPIAFHSRARRIFFNFFSRMRTHFFLQKRTSVMSGPHSSSNWQNIFAQDFLLKRHFPFDKCLIRFH